jgi:N-acetylneuraminate synthase
MKIFIIAELGINHNGDLGIAKKLIEGAKLAGADAVKFQKRTVNKVYDKKTLDSYRDSPWGKTVREQKEGLELKEKDYDEINKFCSSLDISWFASSWDIDSQVFLRKYNLKYNKVASAMLTHLELLNEIAKEKKHTFISTGMHTIEEIARAVDIFKKHNCAFEVMHTVSTYPMKNEDANLLMIKTLREKFKCNVGYSGHENGRAVSVAAAAMGITSLERHVTLDRTMYGSDQAASLEIEGFKLLINYVRVVEKAMGDGVKKILEEEKIIRKKLSPLI